MALKYSKRPGTSADHGHLYEKLLCLRLLQVLEEKNLDFYLANNVDSVGIFDDIVCRIKRQNKFEFLFLQAKHAISVKQIRINEKDKNVSLTEIAKVAIDSFLKIKNLFVKAGSENLKSIFTNYEEFENCEFVFFTNRKISPKAISHLIQVKNISENLNYLSCDHGKYYKFPKFSQNSFNKFHKMLENIDRRDLFIANFTLCIEQANNDQLSEIITTNIKSTIDKTRVLTEVKEEIKTWFSSTGNIKYLSNDDRIINKCEVSIVKKICLEQFCKNPHILYKNTFLCSFLEILDKNKIVIKTYRDEDMLVHTNLVTNLIDYLKVDDISKNSELLLIDGNIDQNLLTRTLSTNCSFNLVIALINKDYDKSRNIVDICRDFAENQQKHVFILCHESVCIESNFLLPPISLDNFVNEKQDYFFQKEVIFQGLKLKLEDVFREKLYLINPEIICQIALNKEVIIGKQLVDTSTITPIYYPRNFILNDVNDFYIWLENVKKNEKLRDDHFVMICSLPNIFDEKILYELNCPIITDISKIKKYRAECKKLVNVFEYSNPCTIKCISGNYNELSKDMTESSNILTISEDFIIENKINSKPENRIIIISDIPGCGKTLTLKNLTIKLKAKYSHMFVIYFSPNLFRKQLKYINTFTPDSSVDFISENVLKNTYCDREIFKKFCSEPEKVIILIDAYDEISPFYSKLVNCLILQLMQTKIQNLIITTRPHCEKELQKLFKSNILLRMSPFSEELKKEFVYQIWKLKFQTDNVNKSTQENDLHFVADVLLNRTFSVYDECDESFAQVTSVPLFLKILSEVYYDSFLLPAWIENVPLDHNIPAKNINLYSLFNSYYEAKLKIFVDDKHRISDILTATRLFKTEKKCSMESHQTIAILEIFGDKNSKFFFPDDMNDIDDNPELLGFVAKDDKNQFRFCHKTFAEFFSATRILAILKSRNPSQIFLNFFLSEILFKDEYHMVRNFLNDCILDSNFNFSSDLYLCCRSIENEKTCDIHYRNSYKYSNNILYIINHFKLFNIYTWLQNACKNSASVFNKALLIPNLNIYFQTGLSKDEIMSDVIDYDVSFKFKTEIFTNAMHLQYYSIIKHFIELDINFVNNCSYNKNSPLCIAIEGINLEMIKILISAGAKINCHHSHELPIICAIKTHDLNIIKYLIENGADINIKDKRHGRNLLMNSVKNVEIVKLLVEKYNFDVNSIDNNGVSVLDFAVSQNCFKTIEYLLTRNVNVRFNNDSALKALLDIISFTNDFHILKLILLHSYVHLLDDNNPEIEFCQLSPLTIAIICNDNERVKKYLNMIKNGIKKVQNIAIKSCLLENNIKMLSVLLENGLDINLRVTKLGETCLTFAIYHKVSNNVIEYLIKMGCDIHMIDETEKAPIFAVFQTHNDSISQILIENKVNLNILDHKKKSPLMYVAADRGQECLKNFIENGADINMRNSKGESALWYAIKNERVDNVQYLLEQNAEVDLKNHKEIKETLMVNYNLNILQLILKKAYIPLINIENPNEGVCDVLYPLTIAILCNDLDLVDKLLEKGACVNPQNQLFYWFEYPLFSSISIGNEEIINKLLTSNDIDLNIHCGENETTLLMFAAMNRNFNIVKKLINKGMNINAIDKKGDNVLWYTVAYNYDSNEIIQYLIENNVDLHSNNNSALQQAVKNMIGLRVKGFGNLNSSIYLKFGTPDSRKRLGLDKIELLLKSGANVHAAIDFFIKKGKTHFHFDHTFVREIFETLIDYFNFDTYFQTYKSTLLFQCCKVKNSKMLSVLLNSKNYDFKKEIYDTINSCDIFYINILFESGIDINIKLNENYTPLIIACIKGDVEIVKILLEFGADAITCRDKHGNTAIKYAQINQRNDILKLLNDSFAPVYSLCH